MRALALEHVLDRDQAVLIARARRNAEVVADVREQHDVDVLEHSGAHVVSLGAEQFFGDAGPEPDGALRCSRSITFFTASAAMMFSGMPELWPSP